jgi:hypothetical protein
MGHCVYCNNDGSTEKLSEEHIIIPRAYGGHRTLGAASCGDCRDKTHAFEGQCCRTMFKALRVHQEIRTRNPRNRPTHLPILVGKEPQNAPIEAIPVDRAPGVAPFPIFGTPAILRGLPPSNRVDFHGSIACSTTGDAIERQRKLIADGRSGALAYSEIPLGQFLRSLAKIAHCYVVSQVGLCGFEPVLIPDILGATDHPFYYVGGLGPIPLMVPNPTVDSGLHQISPMTLTIRRDDNIAVQTRLFCQLAPCPVDTVLRLRFPPICTPTYLAIVGRYSGPKGDPHPVFV